MVILHRICFKQCLLEFRINKRYVMHWKKIFNLHKYYNIRVHQCTLCFKVTRRTAQGRDSVPEESMSGCGNFSGQLENK